MQGRKEHFFLEYRYVHNTPTQILTCTSFSLPNSNFTTSRSGARGAHSHQKLHFLLPILPFHSPHSSRNSWPFPVLWLSLTFLSLKSTKHTVLFLCFTFLNNLLADVKRFLCRSRKCPPFYVLQFTPQCS